jgi:hypothetical protein
MSTCKDCGWRDAEKICNNPHIIEPMDHQCGKGGLSREEMPKKEDCLVYSYDEGGWFEAGDNFGCIYFKDKPLQDDKRKV